MTGPQAAKRAGITYRQLDHWCRKGYLGPEFLTKPDWAGSGTPRNMGPRDLARLTHIARLVNLGIQAGRAVQLLETAVEVDEHLFIESNGIRIVLAAAA